MEEQERRKMSMNLLDDLSFDEKKKRKRKQGDDESSSEPMPLEEPAPPASDIPDISLPEEDLPEGPASLDTFEKPPVIPSARERDDVASALGLKKSAEFPSASAHMRYLKDEIRRREKGVKEKAAMDEEESAALDFTYKGSY